MTSCASQMVIPRPTDSVFTGELTHVLKNGILVIATDGSYPPQSRRNHDVSRAVTTHCYLTQSTANQFEGFDTDTSALADLVGGDGVHLDAALTDPDTGNSAIKSGLPIKQLGDAVYGVDFTSPAAKFDLQALAQFP